MHDRFVVVLLIDVLPGQVVASRIVVGIELDRAPVRLDRLVPGRVVERVVQPFDVIPLAIAQTVDVVQRFLRVLTCFRRVALVPMSHRELGQGHCEIGVQSDRTLQGRNGFALGPALVEVDPLDVRAIRLDRIRRHRSELAVDDFAAFRRDQVQLDLAGQVVDHREHRLLANAFGLLRGQHLPAPRILDSHVDPERLAGAHVATQDCGARTGLTRNGLHDVERDLRLIGPPQPVQDLVQPIRPQHGQIGGLREVGDEHVGQARPQPIQLGGRP